MTKDLPSESTSSLHIGNQQYAAACIFFELKWANCIVPNLAYIESKYGVGRRQTIGEKRE
jgi:hypothetical protein